MHDRKDDVRDVGLEALGNKTSQLRERCRGDSGADAWHGWTQTENSHGRNPRTQERQKNTGNCRRKEHTQPQGKELKLLVIKHSTI